MKLTIKSLLYFSLVVVLFSTACSSVRDVFSRGQEEFRNATNAYAEGRYLESMVHATNAIIIDPDFLAAREFVRDHFDSSVSQAQNRLQRLRTPATTAQAEERFTILNNLTIIYANLQRIGLPFRHPKNAWIWTTPIVEYNSQRNEARELAFSLVMNDARDFVSRNRVMEAEAAFVRALNNYTRNETHRLMVTQTVVEEICFQASRILNTTVIENAIIANAFFRSAARFLPNDEEAKSGIINSAIYTSYLYLEQGNAQEEAGGESLWKAAFNSYRSAVEWDSTNEHAVQGKERVREKLAEMYFLRAVSAEVNKDFDIAVAQYESVQQWIPNYKNAMPQMYTLRIRVKNREALQKIEQMNEIADLYFSRLSTVSRKIDAASRTMEQMAALSVNSIGLNKSIQIAINQVNTYADVPVVNESTIPLSENLKRSKMPVEAMSAVFAEINLPLLIPAITAIDNNKAVVDDLRARAETMLTVFRETQQMTNGINDCALNLREEERFKALEQAVDSLNFHLSVTLRSLNTLSERFVDIEKFLDEVNTLPADMLPVISKVDLLRSDVEKVKPALDDLKSVLDKRYKLAGYSMTARRYLNSPPIPIRAVREEWDIMIASALSPKIKNLKINMNQVEGFDKLRNRFDRLPSWKQQFTTNEQLMKSHWDDYRQSEQRIRSGLNLIKTEFGCKAQN